jgi:hypothetical protein
MPKGRKFRDQRTPVNGDEHQAGSSTLPISTTQAQDLTVLGSLFTWAIPYAAPTGEI